MKVLKVVQKLLRWACAVTICMLTVILTLQVVNRNFFGHSFVWVEELAGISMIYLTFLGSAVATLNNGNTRIDFFIRLFPRKINIGFNILGNIICMGFVGVLCRYSYKLMGNNMKMMTAAMKLPVSVTYCGMFIGCALMIIFYFIRTYIEIQTLQGKDMSTIEEDLS